MSTKTIQQVPTDTYVLDAVHSTFGFAIKHNGISTFRGQFEQVEAELVDGVLRGTAQVESLRTAIGDLKAHLLGPEFFNVQETPTITFRSTDIRIADDGSVAVDGELTIRGVGQSVTAEGTIASGQNFTGAEVIGFDLETDIDRREYGLSWQARLPSGSDVLGWNVTLDVHLELVKA